MASPPASTSRWASSPTRSSTARWPGPRRPSPWPSRSSPGRCRGRRRPRRPPAACRGAATAPARWSPPPTRRRDDEPARPRSDEPAGTAPAPRAVRPRRVCGDRRDGHSEPSPVAPPASGRVPATRRLRRPAVTPSGPSMFSTAPAGRGGENGDGANGNGSANRGRRSGRAERAGDDRRRSAPAACPAPSGPTPSSPSRGRRSRRAAEAAPHHARGRLLVPLQLPVRRGPRSGRRRDRRPHDQEDGR